MNKAEKKRTRKIVRKKALNLFKNYVEEYSTFSKKQIYDKAVEVIQELEEARTAEIEADLETSLEALKFVIDKKRLEGETGFVTDLDFKDGYPEIENPLFAEKIYKKGEFYLNRFNKIDTTKTLEELSRERCSGFKLNNNQKFIKTFLSPNTPYNGCLLFHGVGVGKTCSSISVAEGFIPELEKINKKVYILLNPSIKENFAKNIFNIKKVEAGKPNAQCTRSTYINRVKRYRTLDQLKSRVDKIISKKYEFLGYQQFANMINKIEESIKRKTGDKYLIQRIFKERIKRLFSDTVMIIDEAHNIKEGAELSKILPPILEKVVKIADGMKLLLLTATPMFDTPSEIVGLINLLLLNDKKPILKRDEVFDGKDNIKMPNGKDLLIHKTRGYISYMRGENPLAFPLRLYPESHSNLIKEKDVPQVDIKGGDIEEEERIQNLKIIGCPMVKDQLQVYEELEAAKFGAFELPGLLSSNIIYPNPYSGVPSRRSSSASSANNSDSENSPQQMISNDKRFSKAGFEEFFKQTKKAGKVSFSAKPGRDISFLDEKKIGEYSAKISTILQNIKDSSGIIFIYSQFIWGGVVPLALALEYNGYSKFGGSILECETKKAPLIKKTINGVNFNPKYIIISGDKDLSNKAYENYLKIENENRDGSKVQVIIGSESAAEGLDFKYVREVHILDPWYHLNKTEQIIGRGVRYCSHIELPLAHRNVMIYLYAATRSKNPSRDKETNDLKMYRIAETKSKKTADVEYILKQNAVDCNLNLEGNRFLKRDLDLTIDLITSKGEEIKGYPIYDIDNSKICNYKSCDFKCLPGNKNIGELTDDQIDKSTFDIDSISDSLYDIIDKIAELYKFDLVYDLNEILEYPVLAKMNLNKEIIYAALDRMIKEKIIIKDDLERNGTIIYKGGYYIFVPKYFEDRKVTMDQIRKPRTQKYRKLDITGVVKSLKIPTKTEALVEVSTSDFDFNKVFNDSVKKYERVLKGIKRANSELIQNKLRKRAISTVQYNSLMSILDEILEKKTVPKEFEVAYTLVPSIKEAMIKYLLTKEGEKTPEEKSLFNIFMKTNILLEKRDVYLGDAGVKKQSPDPIWGFKIAIDKTIKYFKFDKDAGSFTPATAAEEKEIKKTNLIKKPDIPDPSIVLGYYEEKQPENVMVLKIRDQRGQGKKGTQIKTGSICGNDGMAKDKIMGFISHIKGDLGDKLFSKDMLCRMVENYLYDREMKRVDGEKHLFTFEESIEYGLTKKT